MSSPENLARVIQFALTSARVRFMNMPAVLDEALAEREGTLYGHKLVAWQSAWLDRQENFYQVCDLYDRMNDYDDERGDLLLLYLSQLPGLGLVKGGFVAQMVAGVSGCIDTVNARRFGYSAGMMSNYRFRPKRIRTLAGRLGACAFYNREIEKIGGTAELWNSWCHAQSERYPVPFPHPETVSEHHITCLRTFPEGETL